MLSILILALFLKNFICATALPGSLTTSPSQGVMETGSSLPETRTVLSILYSCIATTFACTWVSVHPNIPFFGEGEWVILGRKIHLMIMALIAPELMIMWAIKQSIGAKSILNTIKEKYPIAGESILCTPVELIWILTKYAYRTRMDTSPFSLPSDGRIQAALHDEREMRLHNFSRIFIRQPPLPVQGEW